MTSDHMVGNVTPDTQAMLRVTVNGEVMEVPLSKKQNYRFSKPEQVADRVAKGWRWCAPDGSIAKTRRAGVTHDNGAVLLTQNSDMLTAMLNFH